MQFTKEALELIQTTAQTAKGPQIIDVDDARTIHMAIDGLLNRIEVPPPHRNHFVESLDDLIGYAGNCPDGSIWHDANGVILLVDDDDRRDLVTFMLTRSEQLDAIAAASAGPITQQDLVRLLRMKLDLPDLAMQFRRLDWAKSDTGRAEIQHGKESLGREIMAEVQGIDKLPEDFRVEVPLYNNTGEREVYLIRIGIEIDPVNRVFRVAPMPGELEAASDSHQADIQRRLIDGVRGSDGSTYGIYYGRP